MPSIAGGYKMAQVTCNALEDWGCECYVPIITYDYALPPFLQMQGRLKDLSNMWRACWSPFTCCMLASNIGAVIAAVHPTYSPHV